VFLLVALACLSLLAVAKLLFKGNIIKVKISLLQTMEAHWVARG
jgi:hypothetical protein